MFKLGINKIVRYFIIADLLLLGGWGLMAPVFSIFIVEEVRGATIVTVGAISALYWIVKSLLQIPIAIYIDKQKGEKDDYMTLILGLFLAGCAALSFMFARTIPLLFFVTLIHATAFALYVPSWSSIFSRHLDKNKVALEWSLNSTGLGLAHGLTALLSGVAVKFFGFNAVFIFAGVFSFLSALLLFTVPDIVLPKRTSSEAIIRDHSPHTIHH